MEILSQYVADAPAEQNVLNIFAGEWSSRMPNPELKVEPGKAALFQDNRVTWAIETLGGVKGEKVLELGPLEGGHSYMLQQMGAREIIAVEANTRAFLKCLCIKEIFKLDKTHFLLGDFMPYLAQTNQRFQVVFASGVLYHMLEPLELLKHIARVSEKVFLWTHYYDRDIIEANENLKHKFAPPATMDFEGEHYELAEQSYKDALEWSGFCGGPKANSRWLTRESLLRALENFGFRKIEIAFEQPEHPNGPSLALCALKKPPRRYIPGMLTKWLKRG